MLAFDIFIQDMLGRTLFLFLCCNGKKSFFLFHYDQIGIFVQDLQHRMTELMLVAVFADLYLHARSQREVVLSLDIVIDQHYAVGQQSLYTCTAHPCHFLHQELHQFGRFCHIINCILCGGTCSGTSAGRIAISCHDFTDSMIRV